MSDKSATKKRSQKAPAETTAPTNTTDATEAAASTGSAQAVASVEAAETAEATVAAASAEANESVGATAPASTEVTESVGATAPAAAGTAGATAAAAAAEAVEAAETVSIEGLHDQEIGALLDADVQREQRRSFLKQAAVTAGVVAASGWAWLAPPRWPMSLQDPDGERGKPKAELIELPKGGFAVPAKGNVLGIAHGTLLEPMVRGAIDAIGGMARFISKGDIVVIKPNVAFERTPALGATTHPELLKVLIRLVKEAGAAEVRVADNPIESPESCFARSGILEAVDVAKGRIYIPHHADFKVLHVPGAKLIEKWPFFWRPFIGANKVIGIAPVKDHNLCGASMTTKNWYGLLGGRRNQFHQDIHTIISDLALMMRPTFVLLDGTRVMFQSGPTGGSLDDVRPGNTIVAATDSLAADSFGWDELLQRKGKSLPGYFAQGATRKLGEPKWKSVPHQRIQLG